MNFKTIGKVFLPIMLLLFLLVGCGNKEFTVEFNTDGGTPIANQTVKNKDKIDLPIPTKEGYKFLYWELDGKEFKANDKITKSSMLKAVWEKIAQSSYKITFNSNGGTTIASQTVEDGQKITKPTVPTKEGYKFLYWELNGTEYDFDQKVTSNIELIAKWEVNETSNNQTPIGTKYTVTFNSDGGSKVSSKTIEQGKTVAKPTAPTKSGYNFLGWYLNNSLYNFSSKVTKNITLVAKWEKIANTTPVAPTKYTVTFNSDGGSAISSQSIISGEKVLQPANPVKNGYTFVKWTLNGNDYNFNNGVTANITLVAVWQQNPDIYTIERVEEFGLPLQYKVFVKKNGTLVSASEVLDSSENRLGRYESSVSAILVTKGEYNSIAKAKLNDGTIVNISK